MVQTRKTPEKKNEKETSDASAPEAANQDEYQVTLEEALDLAKGHHMAGNSVLADRTYRDILRTVPDHYPTTFLLGVLLYQTGNLIEAKLYLEKATESEPTDVRAWNNLGAVMTDLQQWEDALGFYNKALKIDPEFEGALNNKSLTLRLLGREEESEACAALCLEKHPDNEDGLINLGIILSVRKKDNEALDIWDKASKLYPENPSVWINWANSLRVAGRFAESEVKCRKALELDSESPEALNNLGNALRDRGEIEEAEEVYRTATNLRPNFVEAHNNLAIALCDQGRYEEAVIAARYAVAFQDDHAQAHSTLSMALSQMGDYAMARATAQKAIYLDPENPEYYLDLADANSMADLHHDAEAALQEALKRETNSARVYKKIADLKESMGEHTKAMEAIEKAIELVPDMPLLWMRKGQIYQMLNEMENAFEALDHAVSLAPNWVVLLQCKAEMLITVNENEEAERYVRRAMAINDKVPGAYATLTSLKKFTEDDEDFKKLLALEKDEKKWGLGGAAVLNYALSDAYGHIKDYEKSFEHLMRANDFKRRTVPYDPAAKDELVNMLKTKFTPEYMKEIEGKGCDSNVPVFILGMPRSGTTLTEQIISSHPDVYGAGELPDIGNAREEFGGVDFNNAKELGEYYVELVKKRDKTGKAKRITDKMPGNYVNIGFILSILPNAKIIHCRRNPVDNCLSCYQQNFANGQYWSYNLEELGDEYNRYREIMQFWRELVPGSFLEIDYEETVNNFEEQARKLIDFVGLEWHDACLEPHKHKRAVLTASKAQVTKPIYKSSVAKWKRYEEQLQPLVRKVLPEEALPEEA